MSQPTYAFGEMLTLPNLRRVRQLKLLSQRQLAMLAEVSPATIASIEAGRSAQYETVKKLCGALGVGVQELVGDE